MNARALAVGLCGLLAPLCAQEGQEKQKPAASADAWVLRGRAVDERGGPIAKASLALLPHDRVTVAAALAEPRATTGEDGRFELAVEEPATPAEWRVPVLAAPGRTMVLLQPGGVWLPGPDRRTFDLGDLVLLPGVTLRGHVRTAGGRPLAGAWVEAKNPLTALALRRSGMFDARHEHASAAVTDEQGAFALDGAPADGAILTVRAGGHHRLVLPFVLPGEPLVVTLTPGGYAEGVVKDALGRPRARATLTVSYVAGEDDSRPHQSDADGTFRITLALPHAYRVEAHGDSTRWISGETRGELREGPAKDIVLTTGRALDPDRALVLRTSDAATGKAIEEVRASAIWGPPEMLEHFRSQTGIHDRAEPQRGPGEIRLPGPGPDEPPTGMVVVRAEGYAPLVLEEVEWSDSAPPRLEAKLVRESVLTGVVVDARTRAPLPGAVVVLGDDDDGIPWFAGDHEEMEPGRRLTDEAGRFRAGGLAAGAHRLRAAMFGRPRGEAVEVEVGSAATKEGIELTLPSGSRLAGKLTGAPIGPGWELRLRAVRELGGWRHPQEEEWAAPRSAVAPDGSFALTGVPPGNHELRLRIPHRGGHGGWLDLPLDLLRVRTADVERDFDVADALPGTIRGRVTVAGASIPSQRLAVAAFLAREEGEPEWREEPHVVEPVAADGSFAMPAAPGAQRVEVLDLATQIPLALAEGVQVAAGATTELPLRVELVPVRVRLKPEKDGGSVVAASLEVLVQHERRAADRAAFAMGNFEFDSGAGVALAGRADDVDLLLPLRPARFLVRSHHSRVQEGNWNQQPIGEAEFTPKKDGENVVEIAVRVPPKPEGK